MANFLTVILGLVVIPGGLESFMKIICIIKIFIMEFQWKSRTFIHIKCSFPGALNPSAPISVDVCM